MAKEGPTFETQALDEQECLQQMTTVDKVQEITDFSSDTTVTLKAPSGIVNAGSAAGVIAYKLRNDSDAFITEHFEAGQEKLRAATVIGGTGSGTAAAITKVIVTES